MQMAVKMDTTEASFESNFRKKNKTKIEQCVSTAQARTDCKRALVVERPRRLKITPKNQMDPKSCFLGKA